MKVLSVLPLLATGGMALSSEVTDMLDMLANSADASIGLKHSMESLLHGGLSSLFNEFEVFSRGEAAGPSEYPYFGIIPPYQGSLLPGASALSWVLCQFFFSFFCCFVLCLFVLKSTHASSIFFSSFLTKKVIFQNFMFHFAALIYVFRMSLLFQRDTVQSMLCFHHWFSQCKR
jgi:hypothetical protein